MNKILMAGLFLMTGTAFYAAQATVHKLIEVRNFDYCSYNDQEGSVSCYAEWGGEQKFEHPYKQCSTTDREGSGRRLGKIERTATSWGPACVLWEREPVSAGGHRR